MYEKSDPEIGSISGGVEIEFKFLKISTFIAFLKFPLKCTNTGSVLTIKNC
jgi:hypothetical protein